MSTKKPTAEELEKQCAELKAAGYDCRTVKVAFSNWNSIRIPAETIKVATVNELKAIKSFCRAQTPHVGVTFNDDKDCYTYDADGYIVDREQQLKWLFCNTNLSEDEVTVTCSQTGITWEGPLRLNSVNQHENVPLHFKFIEGRVHATSTCRLALPLTFTEDLTCLDTTIPDFWNKAYHVHSLMMMTAIAAPIHLADIPLTWQGSAQYIQIAPQDEFPSIEHLKLLLDKRCHIWYGASSDRNEEPAWVKMINTHANTVDWAVTLQTFDALTGQSYFEPAQIDAKNWLRKYAVIRTENGKTSVALSSVMLDIEQITRIPKGAFPEAIDTFDVSTWRKLKTFENFPSHMQQCRIRGDCNDMDWSTWNSTAETVVIPKSEEGGSSFRLPARDLGIKHLDVAAISEPSIEAARYLVKSGMRLDATMAFGRFIQAYREFCKTGDFLALAAVYAKVYGEELNAVGPGPASLATVDADLIEPLS